MSYHRCQDTIIGGAYTSGISGGERKRVCIGNEILLDPSLLFLDEPTSGLDSTTALRIAQMLHNIAHVCMLNWEFSSTVCHSRIVTGGTSSAGREDGGHYHTPAFEQAVQHVRQVDSAGARQLLVLRKDIGSHALLLLDWLQPSHSDEPS